MNPTEFKPTSLVERLMPHSKPLRAVLFIFMDIVACVIASTVMRGDESEITAVKENV